MCTNFLECECSNYVNGVCSMQEQNGLDMALCDFFYVETKG